ncbi:MAG: hypothetical protein ACT4NL_09825 [Pseudomarimonas sp.]
MTFSRAGFLNGLLALLAAVVATAAMGSILQSQLNLNALAALGVTISANTRWQTTCADLLGFAPTWAAIVAGGFVIAFPVAAGLSRWRPDWRFFWFVLAGAIAILTALLAMRATLGLTAVAAARTAWGMSLLVASGALGGWVFWWVRRA